KRSDAMEKWIIALFGLLFGLLFRFVALRDMDRGLEIGTVWFFGIESGIAALSIASVVIWYKRFERAAKAEICEILRETSAKHSAHFFSSALPAINDLVKTHGLRAFVPLIRSSGVNAFEVIKVGVPALKSRLVNAVQIRRYGLALAEVASIDTR